MSRTFTLLPRIIALAFFVMTCGRAQDGKSAADPRFVGYLSSQGEWQFALSSEPGVRPIWLRLGESENGVTPRKYDSAAEILVVETHGRLLELKLEGGLAHAHASTAPDPNLNRQQAMQIARREALSRDGWRRPRLFVSTTANGNFQILISQSTPLRTERRTLVLRPNGEIAFYLPLSDLPYGVPDLLFPSYQRAKPYSFVPRSP